VVSVTLPRKELRRGGSDQCREGGAAETRDAVTVTVEVGETRFADKAGVASELQTLLTKRLVDGGLAVARRASGQSAPEVFRKPGGQLQVVEAPAFFGRPTGRPSGNRDCARRQDGASGNPEDHLDPAGTDGNPHMLRGGEVSDQAFASRPQPDPVPAAIDGHPVFVAADPKPATAHHPETLTA